MIINITTRRIKKYIKKYNDNNNNYYYYNDNNNKNKENNNNDNDNKFIHIALYIDTRLNLCIFIITFIQLIKRIVGPSEISAKTYRFKLYYVYF